MRLENQAYLIKQMDEKGGRNGEDQYLTGIQSQIMERDTQEYNGVEKQKVIDRRLRNIEHSKEVTKQIQFKTEQSVPAMSKAEISMNKPLLKLVNRTLKARDANWNSSGGGYGEEE
ncbi:unnamed protein product [Polarella glacialis]|nr:unnamed protein product [Polarella glacialis]